jgi:hypothetical protein
MKKLWVVLLSILCVVLVACTNQDDIESDSDRERVLEILATPEPTSEPLTEESDTNSESDNSESDLEVIAKAEITFIEGNKVLLGISVDVDGLIKASALLYGESDDIPISAARWLGLWATLMQLLSADIVDDVSLMTFYNDNIYSFITSHGEVTANPLFPMRPDEFSDADERTGHYISTMTDIVDILQEQIDLSDTSLYAFHSDNVHLLEQTDNQSNTDVIIHDDEFVTITYKGCEVRGAAQWDTVMFQVANKTERFLAFRIESLSFDGVNVDEIPMTGILGGSISAKSNGEVAFMFRDGLPTLRPSSMTGKIHVRDVTDSNMGTRFHDITFIEVSVE